MSQQTKEYIVCDQCGKHKPARKKWYQVTGAKGFQLDFCSYADILIYFGPGGKGFERLKM